MNLAPFLGVDLVGTDEGPDLVVEDLGGGAGQRRQAGIPQLHEEVPDIQSRDACAP